MNIQNCFDAQIFCVFEKKIITVSTGCTPEGIQSISNNELTMSVDLGIRELGYLALTSAVDMINLKALYDKGLKYRNGDFKISWLLSNVIAYDKSNIAKLISDRNKNNLNKN